MTSVANSAFLQNKKQRLTLLALLMDLMACIAMPIYITCKRFCYLLCNTETLVTYGSVKQKLDIC